MSDRLRKRKVWIDTRLLAMCHVCSRFSPKNEKLGWYLWKFFYVSADNARSTDIEGLFCSIKCFREYMTAKAVRAEGNKQHV